MGVNFSPLDIGRRALRASQLGITVTGQNIANVNTPGYTRQTVHLAPTPGDSSNLNLTGAGVSITGVRAARDQFIDARLQKETGTSGRLAAERDALYPVDGLLNESGSGAGLRNSLNEFFGAFRDLEANPTSQGARSVVVEKARVLTSAFHTTRSQLGEIRRNADLALRGTVDEANQLARQVAALNARIGDLKGSVSGSSELIDQRTEALRRLSELTGARALENTSGSVTVTLGDGQALVIGDRAETLTAVSTPPDGLAQIQLNGQPAAVTDGSLRGLQNAIEAIGGYITSLDDLAASVAGRVNTLHASGTDLSGNAGTDLFVPSSGTTITAANIDISAAIRADSRLIVGAAAGAGSGDATVARGIANLLTDTSSTAGTRSGSFNEILASVVRDAGSAVRNADDALLTQQVLLQQTQAQRDAVSGVSLDEEAVNLLQYQRAFEAAARFLNIADELTQTILSLGR